MTEQNIGNLGDFFKAQNTKGKKKGTKKADSAAKDSSQHEETKKEEVQTK